MSDRQPTLVDLTFEFSRLLRQQADGSDAAHTVNMLRAHALTIIRETPDMTMTELSRTLRVSASSATSFVDRLVREGWVKRSQDKANRKLVHLRLTKAGEAALARCAASRKQMLRHLLSLISTEDQQCLRRILSNLNGALHSTHRPSPASHGKHS
jgi:DNA-binding MarR family transcriptional regulator